MFIINLEKKIIRSKVMGSQLGELGEGMKFIEKWYFTNRAINSSGTVPKDIFVSRALSTTHQIYNPDKKTSVFKQHNRYK